MAKVRLPRFNIADPITSDSGRPTITFHKWVNGVVGTLQSAYNDLDQLVGDIAESLKQAGIAIETANEAKSAATSASKDTALVNSYVSPSNILSAVLDTVDATKAVITIADHTRMYGDGTSKPVTGSTIVGLSLSATYYVTYMDATRAGGSVTYMTTTDYLAAGQGSDRHLVGSIVTPAAGSTAPSTGDPVRPPGVVAPRREGEPIP